MYGLHLVDQEIPYFLGRNVLWKCYPAHLITSPQRPSMHRLCTEVPTIKLTLLIPPTGQSNINRETSTFFIPKFS